MEIATGQVATIRYVSPTNGFTVATIDAPTVGLIDIVGVMPGLTEGINIEATGQFEDSPKWGRQFKVQSFRTERPSDGFGLETYLDNVVDGIGPTLASKIVQTFGAKTAEAMTDPNALMNVQGIGRKNVKSIVESWKAHETERRAMQGIYGFLAQYGISPTYATKLYAEYGFDAVKTIEADPYRLMDLDRIGFLKADAVAQAMGIPGTDPRRIRAGILYIVDQQTSYGNCYTTRENLVTAVQDLIKGVDTGTIDRELQNALKNRDRLIDNGGCIYPTKLYEAEAGLAQRLVLLSTQERRVSLSTFELLSSREIRDRLPKDITYTPEQLQAIENALRERISIITGGPGTGKSTIIRGIVQAAESALCDVILMAPTGLAAKRMKELSGHDAGTVHRTLGVDPQTGGFLANEYDPLRADVVIVDESSMLDIRLAHSMVRAIAEGANLVFVGDVDQLPSVGPGNVLRDLIDSGTFPVTRLTTIFRQSEESLIIPNAHAVNAGQMPDFSTSSDGDFFLFPATEAQEAADWVIDLVTQRIPESLGIPAKEIRVLTPQHKTDAGVEVLNRRLQAVLNPPHPDKIELKYGDRVYRVGDRVLRVAKNDYDRMIVNGDQGTVTLIDKDDKGKPRLWVTFDDRSPNEEDTFDFTGEDIGTLRHGWALTIHKSQGLEFRAAVVVVLTTHYRMLVRNLLYTAVTRAKEKVIVVGNRKAIGIAVHNNRVEQRTTRLQERIHMEIETRKEVAYA